MNKGAASLFTYLCPGGFTVATDTSYSYGISIVIEDFYDIIFFKFAFDTCNTYWQEARSFSRSHGYACSFIDMYFSFCKTFGVCDPFFYAGWSGFPEGEKRVQTTRPPVAAKSGRILSLLPFAMMTSIPSSATLRAILYLVNIPPLPKEDFPV